MPRANKPTDVFTKIDMHNGDTTVCWEWKGNVNAKDGRPYFTVQGKRRPAYNIILTLYSGEPLQENQVARHSCDNPICCNPNHLSWGTHQDNMNDMKERERHGLPKIVVKAIRNLLREGRSHKEIAKLYGVARESITAINNERSHKDVE